jgi:uncharacterized protein YjbJ (UPF0337 family)
MPLARPDFDLARKAFRTHHPADAGPVQAVPRQRPPTRAGSGKFQLAAKRPFRTQPADGTKPSSAVLSRQFSRKSKRSKTMNWDRVEGNWKQFKGNVQQRWGKLTDDDLNVIEGKRTELSGRLQARYGYAKDEAEKNIDTWLNSVH